MAKATSIFILIFVGGNVVNKGHSYSISSRFVIENGGGGVRLGTRGGQQLTRGPRHPPAMRRTSRHAKIRDSDSLRKRNGKGNRNRNKDIKYISPPTNVT